MAALLHLRLLPVLCLLVLGAIALAACCAALGKQGRFSRSSKAPIGLSARSFANLLEKHGFDPAIALATYCYLQETRVRRFPIVPGDRLDRDLGLSAEEVEQTLLALMALLGSKPALGWQRAPVSTVQDLIVVLQGSPKQAGAVAA